jgi:HAD superfamily hydrolase (TIGR01549 family)
MNPETHLTPMTSGPLDSLDTHGIRAVLFDVDGTLYHQRPVRLCMAMELAALTAGRGHLGRARAIATMILAFRKVREELRCAPDGVLACAPDGVVLERAQFAEAARRIGCDACELEQVIDEWMFRRPLKYLRAARRRAVDSLLHSLTRQGVLVGALSDYPPAAKLEALGLAPHFSLAVCTTDSAINAFKPHPRGFLHACSIWGVAPQEVLYVGDRPDVDAVGAAAAGLRCHLVARHGRGAHDGGRARSTGADRYAAAAENPHAG